MIINKTKEIEKMMEEIRETVINTQMVTRIIKSIHSNKLSEVAANLETTKILDEIFLDYDMSIEWRLQSKNELGEETFVINSISVMMER